jgi:hypothetical protein
MTWVRRVIATGVLLSGLYVPLHAQSFGAALANAPMWMNPNAHPAVSAASGMLLDGATERIAFKFFPMDTTQVTHVDCNFTVVGSPTLVMEVQTDSGSDTPSGTVVNSTTSADQLFNASGFLGSGGLALGNGGTGTLTLNTPYWVVFRDGATGNDPTAATHSVQLRTPGWTYTGSQRLRHYNGSDWTTTSALTQDPLCVLTHASGTLAGLGYTVAQGSSAQTDIFGTNRQSLKTVWGSKTTFAGVFVRVTKTGTPADFQCALFEGSTERASGEIDDAVIVSGNLYPCLFTTPYETAADSVVTFVFRQEADGGDGSNDYDLRTLTVQAGYVASLMPTGWRMRAGTGSDPTGWSDVTTEAPIVIPIVYDTSTAFDEDGGGTVFRRNCIGC